MVEETLGGRADRIKAYSVATRVFGRGDDFDPVLDSIVRIEAARLRRALEHYYLKHGEPTALRISIPKGTYVPEFAAGGQRGDAAPSGADVANGRPLHRRVPKRGFRNPFRIEYAVVNLDTLAELFEAGTTVTPDVLRERGVVRQATAPIKILGRGEIGKALTVHAQKFSESAVKKIAAAGGATEVIGA